MFSFLYAYYGWGSMALRLALGVVFIVHGWPKIKNPSGIAKAVWGGFTPVGLFHGLLEVACGLALITGFWGEQAALALMVIMLGAIYYKAVKWKVPFTSQNDTGWEFDLVILAGLAALLVG